MKSLLAAALAGALTVSAIPVNASAVVNKFKSVAMNIVMPAIF